VEPGLSWRLESNAEILCFEKHQRGEACEGEAQSRESITPEEADGAQGEMNEPLVACVMITNNRPQLARRAIRHFNRQTYKNKLLFVLDTNASAPGQAATEWLPSLNGLSIGHLRNHANLLAIKLLHPDILINLDDDDVSHPNRIASQVLQLQTTQIDRRTAGQGIYPAPAVGYKDLLWWNSVKQEAWLYDNGSNHYCLGTSLCYWPETWRRNLFPDSNIGEWREASIGQFGFSSFVDGEPMIIGEWHGKNGACEGNRPSTEPWEMSETHWSNVWKRVPEWDERLKAIMAL
jgi:glycosyltransferase involved in cell wall biosynthesis